MAHHHHDHDHDHDHDHTKATDFATANKDYFNATASNVPDPRWVELAKRGSAVMREEYRFDEETTTVMDFACNTGLTSRALAPYAKLIVGVDISQSAIDVFNEAVSNQGISSEEMRAVCTELKGEEGELDGLKFDVITCSMAYHHFEDVEEITRILTFFLKPDGVLLVADNMESGARNDVLAEKYAHIVPHAHGFSEDRIRKVFEGAGLKFCSFKPITTVKMHDVDTVIFLAKAMKPSA